MRLPPRSVPRATAQLVAGVVLAVALLTGCTGGDTSAVTEVAAPASPTATSTADAAAEAAASAAAIAAAEAQRKAERQAAREAAQQAARKAARKARKVQARKVRRQAQRQARRIAAANPLEGHRWGVYRGDADQAWGPYTRAGGDTKALLGKIIDQPKTQWFGDWIADGDIGARVRDYIANAQDGDPDALVQMAVFRMQPWEHEACGRLPSAAEQASYKRWIDAFADAVGDTPAAIVLQPDGPFALCVPGGSGIPSSLVAYAAEQFGDLPDAAVYLDAGAADWPAEGQGGVARVLDFLLPAGIEHVRGIALDTTHYSSTSDQVVRGAAIIEALAARGITGKHLVVNTSSNGRPFVFGQAPGPDPDNATVCASRTDTECVTLGIPPTTEVADPAWGLSAEVAALARQYADGYLWIGRPWLFRQNSPFDMARALQLARTTPY